MIIRMAKAEDRENVVDLWRRTGLTVPYNDPYADFDFALGKAASDVVVGELEGSVAASAMVGHDGHRGWVYYVSVEPSRQGQGLGEEIMSACESWLRERGVRKIQLMVRDSNARVKGFYQAIGYEPSPVSVLAKWLE
jgi:ribosomal protein S18 acetylase RimI-like enzyme